jgi:hypothetical protein
MTSVKATVTASSRTSPPPTQAGTAIEVALQLADGWNSELGSYCRLVGEIEKSIGLGTSWDGDLFGMGLVWMIGSIPQHIFSLPGSTRLLWINHDRSATVFLDVSQFSIDHPPVTTGHTRNRHLRQLHGRSPSLRNT